MVAELITELKLSDPVDGYVAVRTFAEPVALAEAVEALKEEFSLTWDCRVTALAADGRQLTCRAYEAAETEAWYLYVRKGRRWSRVSNEAVGFPEDADLIVDELVELGEVDEGAAWMVARDETGTDALAAGRAIIYAKF